MAAGAGAGKALDMGKAMRDILTGKGLPGLPSAGRELGRRIGSITQDVGEKLSKGFSRLYRRRLKEEEPLFWKNYTELQRLENELHRQLVHIGEDLAQAEEQVNVKVMTDLLAKYGDEKTAYTFRNLMTGYSESALPELLREATSTISIPDNSILDLDPSGMRNYVESMGDWRGSIHDVYDVIVSNNLDKPENRRAFAEFIHKNAKPGSGFDQPISTWDYDSKRGGGQLAWMDMVLQDARGELEVFRKAKEIFSKIPMGEIVSAYQMYAQTIPVLENIIGKRLPKLKDVLAETRQMQETVNRQYEDIRQDRVKKEKYKQAKEVSIPGVSQVTALGRDWAWRELQRPLKGTARQGGLILPLNAGDASGFLNTLTNELDRQRLLAEPLEEAYSCRI